jgi:cell division protein FtsB
MCVGGPAMRRSRPASAKRERPKALDDQIPLSPQRHACLTPQVNVDLGIWSKLTKVVVGLLVLALVLLVGVSYLPLIRQNERMRREIMRLDEQLQKEEVRSKQLQAEIDALRNDPKTIERLTREKLGYARPNEMVIRFEPATNNTPVH